MSPKEYLFVYGTLMQSFDNPYAQLLRSNSTLIGEGYMLGRLYLIEHYPGVIVSTVSEERVYGQLFELSDNHQEVLDQLDPYEGIGAQFSAPQEYVREKVSIHCAQGTIQSWVYIYNRPIKEENYLVSGVFTHIPDRLL
ncbi:gamma-glutamylcyclotransferase [Reichenbachiella agarivorans]|uniref:Gamma-glutamylcyclotransferase n=1 Tax=Reichenbachiella agarivorans TaxID=2979464 RepID=A0ABY6CKC5_9BACT|nr:gamma-glutamylcyclotransferase family protein [Reichenbachiella agarivorans]UXP30942.1 gamma-glutamylcyclotransferase [Reichenbachiella agarivorans]